MKQNIELIKMIIKNGFTKNGKHFPTNFFIEYNKIKIDSLLMKILIYQTNNNYKWI